MRVAWLMTDYPKNSQTFNHQEIVSIEKHGVEVVPIALNPPDESDLERPEYRRASTRTLYLKRIPRSKALAITLSFLLTHPIATILAVRVALRTTGTDPAVVLKRVLHLAEAILVLHHCRCQEVRHIHAQFGGTSSTIAMLAAETGRLVDGAGSWTWSCTLHGLDVWNDPPWLLRKKVASASAVICAADYTRSQVLRVSDTSEWPKIRVVRCGIDLDRLAPRPSRPAGTPFRVVTVGRLAPEKGLMVLLEALLRLQESGIDVALSVVGSGRHEAAIADFVARNGLGERVSLVGEVPADQVPGLLREADAFCLPSFAEGVPMAIVEAMAIGIPVVSTQVGGIPEVVIAGTTGICVPAGRSDLLAEGIAALATDPERGLAFSTAARRRVEELYDARKTTLHLLETIQAAARDSLASG
jgi:glycosyltransferase involved in cell wall biosynthesis